MVTMLYYLAWLVAMCMGTWAAVSDHITLMFSMWSMAVVIAQEEPSAMRTDRTYYLPHQEIAADKGVDTMHQLLVLVTDRGGWYQAMTPALVGVVADGNTDREAAERLTAAVLAFIVTAVKDTGHVPWSVPTYHTLAFIPIHYMGDSDSGEFVQNFFIEVRAPSTPV